jgi:hypothetical protein
MECHLVDVHDENGVRQFAFDCIREDRSKMMVNIRADLTMARKYDIRLQELPLICRQFLDRLGEGGLKPDVTVTEDQMAAIRNAAQSAAEKKPRKPTRPSPGTGQAWRNMHL